MTDTIAHSLPGGPLLTRREAIAGAAAAITLPASVAYAATDRARGVVFEDTDGSGRRTSNSRGVPGVMVSNGREVVVTDASGSWSLPVADGESVFVIKPSGWMVPVERATCLPRYARVHAPDGTPSALGLRYAGVAPTGPLPDSIDFPLRRSNEAPGSTPCCSPTRSRRAWPKSATSATTS